MPNFMNVTSSLHRRWMDLQSIVLRCATIAACVSVATACSGGDIVQLPSAPNPDRLWAVQLDASALALAVNGTYQLSATPLNSNGTPLTDLPPVRFRSLNAERVGVNETGLVTALLSTASASVQVVAELTIAGATYSDTIDVYVTDAAHDARSITFRKSWSTSPIPTRLDYMASVNFDVQLRDGAGNLIDGVIPSVISTNPSVLSGGLSYAFAWGLGKAKLLASIVAYGRLVSDSVEITVVLPDSLVNTLWAAPMGQQIVATGGTITWTNSSWENKTFNITFDQNSPAIIGGNIEQLLPYTSATRKFMAPGKYPYRDTINKTTGVVLVRDQPTY